MVSPSEDFLDYDRWFICPECGEERVPCESESVGELICTWCQDEIRENNYDDMILIYGES